MKSFQERFEEYQLSVSGLSSLSDASFLFWRENYLDKKSTLQISDFLVGKIYSFDYNDKLDKSKKFVNRRPLLFFMGFFNSQDKLVFSGLDLVLIPPQYRLAFFSRISSVYESQISTNVQRIEKGDVLEQVQLKCDYPTMDLIMKGIPWKNSYRAWDLQKIRDAKEITYEDWTRIVYLHTRAIEGTPIEEIYKKNSLA
jgi:hypothetical protein